MSVIWVVFQSKEGKDLAEYYASADVFVFPSRTDTFGVVLIESIACGTPVAAYDVTGPKDVITQGVNGFLSDDLKDSIEKCLTLDRDVVAKSAEPFNWSACTDTFISGLVLCKQKPTSIETSTEVDSQ